MGVYLMGVYLLGVYLTGVYLTNVRTAANARCSFAAVPSNRWRHHKMGQTRACRGQSPGPGIPRRSLDEQLSPLTFVALSAGLHSHAMLVRRHSDMSGIRTRLSIRGRGTTQAPNVPAIWAPSSLSLHCGHTFPQSLFTHTSDLLRLMHAAFVPLAPYHLRTFPAGQFPPHRSHRGRRIGERRRRSKGDRE
jgi:hypothetical protein